jgi:hypothetical protein
MQCVSCKMDQIAIVRGVMVNQASLLVLQPHGPDGHELTPFSY